MGNLTLTERAKYALHTFTQDELIDLLSELEEWRSEFDGEVPSYIRATIDELESNHANPDLNDYDDYKSFFDDCVQSLSAHWPAAEVWDDNLRGVIFNAIERGSMESEE